MGCLPNLLNKQPLHLIAINRIPHFKKPHYTAMAATEDASRAHQNNTFRKIELQSPADLTHLQTLSQRAARQNINVAFPPAAQEGGEDELRNRVEALVNGYVEEVFRGVKSNILVNGVEVAESGDGKDGVREVPEGNIMLVSEVQAR